MAKKINDIEIINTNLLDELSQLIVQSKQQVAAQVNSALTLLFWQVGNTINQNIYKINVQNMENKLCQKYRHN